MLDAVEGDNGQFSLRVVIVGLVESGLSAELLIEDMEQLRALLAPDREDMMLDVMDQLVGYCARQVRILPRPQPGDADFGLR